eukprot:CAMPEP_0117447362 /NCGR_PEP_ID=MMETSP0759-20121206/6835_1 /TAXON_ID=63605 /ORGANISM="Percolomonas cosmopolitus, Strain WS" /LENGTH=881 /DNA_ID=CAMNT_0005239693 /DNA_START=139 /DNA_END=2784 /DNA_ORIENTATION=-
MTLIPKSLLTLVIFCVFICFTIAAAAPAAIGTWRPVKAQGSIPNARPFAACTLYDTHLYAYGGRTGVAQWSDSVYKFDLEKSSWSQVKIQATNAESKLPQLAAHTITQFSETEFLAFGGRTGIFSYSNDIYLLNLQQETSYLMKPASSVKPSARWEHSAAYVDGQLFVFGGATTKESFNDIFAFNAKDKKWRAVTPKGASLPNIHGHSATVSNGKVFLIGGYLGQNYNSNVYIYDVANNEMTRVSNSGLVPRAFHTASLVGNYIYVVGGSQDDSKLVSKVQIFHTLKNHVVNYPLAGRFSERKNHCSVVYSRNVVVFGGNSENRWRSTTGRNDVVILDTSSQTRNATNAPLAQRVTAIILDINSEILNNRNYTEGSLVEQQLEAEIEKGTDDQFANLPKRISDCKEIERLYHEVVNNEANRRDIVAQSKMHIGDVKKISDSFGNLREQLSTDALGVEEKLKKLTKLENQLAESSQLHNQAKQDEIRARDQKVNSKKQLSTILSSITKTENQIASAESKTSSIQESLKIYNDMLKNSDADYSKKTEEEKEILDKLRSFQGNLGNATTDVEGLRKKILELEKNIRDTESHLSTLDNLPIEQMRQLYETGDKALKQLMNMFSLVLKVMDRTDVDSPGNADLDQFNPDRIAKRIQAQISQVSSKLKEERELLERLKAELAAAIQRQNAIDGEIAKWKRRHAEVEKAIEQINTLKTDSDKKRAELEGEVKSAQDKVDGLKNEVKELQNSAENTRRDIERNGKDEVQHAHKKEEEAAREALLQKKVRQLRGELEDNDAELRRKFLEAQDIQKDLNEMRSTIAISKELYDKQSKSLNEARDKLNKKLSESEQRLATCETEKRALTKQVKALRKRVAELEAQIKKPQEA